MLPKNSAPWSAAGPALLTVQAISRYLISLSCLFLLLFWSEAASSFWDEVKAQLWAQLALRTVPRRAPVLQEFPCSKLSPSILAVSVSIWFYLLGCKPLARRGQTLYCSCLKIASLQIHAACVRPAGQKLHLQLIISFAPSAGTRAEQRPGLRLGSSPRWTQNGTAA